MKNSKIEWTDHTFNPWWGCTKVSDACTRCYAEAFAKRTGHDVWGPEKPRRFFGPDHWAQPIKWDEAAAKAGERQRVFCASMADVFEDYTGPDRELLAAERVRLFALIKSTPNLDWLLLTKRPENWAEIIRNARNVLTQGGCAETALWLNDWLPTPATSGVYSGRQATSDHPAMPGEAPSNVWFGTTVENQEQANKRIPELLKVPARIRFLSMEPLLEEVHIFNKASGNLEYWSGNEDHSDRIDWIICGGESGPGARPMHPKWARSLRDQCGSANVPFFFKQWGEWLPANDFGFVKAGEVGSAHVLQPAPDVKDQGWPVYRVGKAKAGRLLDSKEWNEFPKI
jgi:protein gp37